MRVSKELGLRVRQPAIGLQSANLANAHSDKSPDEDRYGEAELVVVRDLLETLCI